jgi:hypothetical protein
MNKTEYVILDGQCEPVGHKDNLHEIRELAETYAKADPGKEFFIATITHRIKAVIKTEWDE